MASPSFPLAELARSDRTSSTEVFPEPFAPIITVSGRKSRCTSLRRRNPWIDRFLKWLMEASVFISSSFVSPTGNRHASNALQQLARDHQPLDFAGAFADGAELGVAKKFLHRIVFDEAVAAMDLHGFIADAHGGLGGEQLGHGRFLVDACAGILEPGGAQG